MPCVLHVILPYGGRDLAERLTIRPYEVGERGRPVRPRSDRAREWDTLKYDVSEADFDELSQQFDDATAFLREHQEDVRALTAAGEAYLDFGYSPRPPPVAVSVDRLPQDLIRLAARLDVGIELSLYPPFIP